MKHLKDSINNVDEKYVTIEALSEADSKSTYGGGTFSGSISVAKYGLPPILKYGLPPILKYGVPPITVKYGVPNVTVTE